MEERIKSIYQIEVSSRCNLRCKYCAHPKMPRAKVDMTREIWDRTKEWVKHFIDEGTQGDTIILFGIGESLMHPAFFDYLKETRELVGSDVKIIVTTNGVLVTDEWAEKAKQYKPDVHVSVHRPEKVGPAIQSLARNNLLRNVGVGNIVSPMDWAGQVDWHVARPAVECPWVKNGRAFISAEGDILTCCIDGTGIGKVGHVMDNDPVDEIYLRPYKLCDTCDQYHAGDKLETVPKSQVYSVKM